MPKYSQVLNMPKFWILRSFEYGMVLFIRACHSFVNMPEYVLIDFWNILDSKYAGEGGGGIYLKNSILAKHFVFLRN